MGFITFDTFKEYIKSAKNTFLSMTGGKLSGDFNINSDNDVLFNVSSFEINTQNSFAVNTEESVQINANEDIEIYTQDGGYIDITAQGGGELTLGSSDGSVYINSYEGMMINSENTLLLEGDSITVAAHGKEGNINIKSNPNQGSVNINGKDGVDILSPDKIEAISDIEIFLATNDGTTESGYGSEIRATNNRLDINGQTIDVSAVGGDLNLISTGDVILDVTYDGTVKIDAPLKYGTPVAINSYFSTIPIINSDGVERYILVGTNMDMLTDLANTFAVKVTDDGEGNIAIDGLRVKNYDVLSAEFTPNEVGYRKEAVLKVSTGADVVELDVVNKTGASPKITATVDSEENGIKTWTVTFKATLIGNKTYTVIGYSADGTSGITVDANVIVSL